MDIDIHRTSHSSYRSLYVEPRHTVHFSNGVDVLEELLTTRDLHKVDLVLSNGWEMTQGDCVGNHAQIDSIVTGLLHCQTAYIKHFMLMVFICVSPTFREYLARLMPHKSDFIEFYHPILTHELWNMLARKSVTGGPSRSISSVKYRRVECFVHAMKERWCFM